MAIAMPALLNLGTHGQPSSTDPTTTTLSLLLHPRARAPADAHVPPSPAMADAGASDGDPPPPLCPLCGQPTTAPAPRPLLTRRGPPEAPPAVVRVGAAALREALSRQQAALGCLQAELDAERGAAAGAASEAMGMILRLQREKAEAMMEARQFRRYAEEKMSHDAAELAALEDQLAFSATTKAARTPRRPAASGASTPRLPCATPPSPAASSAPPSGSGGYYPALRCLIDHPPTASEADALDAQTTPRDQLSRRLAHRGHTLDGGAAAPTATTTTPIIRVAFVECRPLDCGVRWVESTMWWRRQSSKVKYPIGQSGNNVGLLLLLDKAPRAGYGPHRLPKMV
ncbi:hypothetical protein ACP4OV_020101 [Aristida adscensionis]